MLSKPMLTVHEVANLLKVREATVRRWIRKRELAAIEFNREYRVPAIHLERFVAARLTMPPAEHDGSQKDGDG